MKFQRELFTEDFLREVTPLSEKHYKEIAHYQDIELAPDLEAYMRCEQAGGLRVYTAREDDGKLIGYEIFFVRHNLHYKNSLQAAQDVLFIDPEKRGFGMDFIDWCDQQLKAEGVQVVTQHIKAKHNFGRMLERLNYELVDLIYSRRLD